MCGELGRLSAGGGRAAAGGQCATGAQALEFLGTPLLKEVRTELAPASRDVMRRIQKVLDELQDTTMAKRRIEAQIP